jgi:hypothetical protein
MLKPTIQSPQYMSSIISLYSSLLILQQEYFLA